ncbi:MAG: monovalent cation/H+ antiporter complex subunit F [Methanomicrobiales archaeon]|nr:monovalent cation/H+ antiporter complex subunit F [Methanomicrobiales archaeon]
MTVIWEPLPYWYPAVAALVVLIGASTIRLVKGPTPADRAVAVDAVNTLVIASMVLLAVIYRQIIFVDIAIVYAVLSYVSTLYIAKYLGGEM